MKYIALILFIIPFICFSQADIPEFLMADTLVTECDGRLFDSGGEDELYGLNEDFTFTVCTETAISITFQGEFSVETGLDFLSIYDGPDTASPVLAANLSGEELPGSFNSISGCVTFHFTSDLSVGRTGFDIIWDSQNEEPGEPTISFPTPPTCGSNLLSLEISTEIFCSEIYLENSSLTGSSAFNILNFNPVGCSPDGLTSTFELELEEPIDHNCLYDLNLEVGVQDNCDSIWLYNVNSSFLYEECDIPIEFVVGSNPLCNAECTTIEATVDGCFTYDYVWDNGLPNGPGPHEVCPGSAETYTVTVTEVATGVISSASFTFEHESIQIIEEDLFQCQSDGIVDLTSNPTGGTFSGPGITDDELGIFNPDAANPGMNTIYYEVDFTQCFDSINITITEINAGNLTASCPFATPTLLTPEPTGGTWSGDQITPEGVFSPLDAGTYSITYETSGCSETLDIDVQEFTESLPFDTLCQSAAPQFLDVVPSGGFWTGLGVEDGEAGIWQPEWTVNGGDVTLTYNAIGCSASYDVYVIPAQIGGVNQNTCPFTEPFVLDETPNPPGGFFEGDGILDTNTGLFDPGSVEANEWHELFYYAPTGCVDTVFMLVQDTEIFNDSLYFCTDEDPLPLNWEGIQRTPWGGSWTGAGAVNVENNSWEFFPDIAGVGEHELFYHNNTCVDSVLMFVYPTELSQDTLTICSAEESIILQELPYGGVWTGLGIIDESTGLFDPSLVPGQTVNISYSNPTFCTGEMVVVVDEFIQAELATLQSIYCSEDTEIDVLPFPDGGELTSPQNSPLFNTSVLGEGTYTFTYSFIDNACSADTSVTFQVVAASAVMLTSLDTVLCDNNGTTLTATGTSGLEGAELVYEWSDGLFPQSQNTVVPESSQFYYVTVNDGCSEPAQDSVYIEVLEPIILEYMFGDTLCFGEPGASIQVSVLPEANYSIMWGDTLGAPLLIEQAGSIHELTVTNVEFGCSVDDVILIPSYSPLSAAFSVNPNDECIPFEANPVEFIDLSINVVSGMWNFGNGDSLVYDGSSPESVYDTAGLYDISLIVQNEGGCVDTALQSICVSDPSVIFIPDIFSPNDDGNNDVLYVRGGGLLNLEFSVYNRWGNRVFMTTDTEYGWDGINLGSKAPSGVYFYQLRARTNQGLEINQSGDITLIR